MRCEGMRRHGGAFTLGPVTWEQCKEDATVMLVVVQGKEETTVPSCMACWEEGIENKGIDIKTTRPI